MSYSLYRPHFLSNVYTLVDDCVLTVMAALQNTTRPMMSIVKRRRKRTTCESRKNYRLAATWLADHVWVQQKLLTGRNMVSGPRVSPATLLTGRNMVERADHVWTQRHYWLAATRWRLRTTGESSNIIDWPQHSGDSGPRVSPATLLTGRYTVEIAETCESRKIIYWPQHGGEQRTMSEVNKTFHLAATCEIRQILKRAARWRTKRTMSEVPKSRHPKWRRTRATWWEKFGDWSPGGQGQGIIIVQCTLYNAQNYFYFKSYRHNI